MLAEVFRDKGSSMDNTDTLEYFRKILYICMCANVLKSSTWQLNYCILFYICISYILTLCHDRSF